MKGGAALSNRQMLIGMKEICEYFGGAQPVHPTTIRRWVKHHGLPVFYNPRPMMLISDAEAWIRFGKMFNKKRGNRK